MHGSRLVVGIIFGPAIVVWAARHLLARILDARALLNDPPRDIRPDEIAPHDDLVTRTILSSVFYVWVMMLGVMFFIAGWQELWR